MAVPAKHKHKHAPHAELEGPGCLVRPDHKDGIPLPMHFAEQGQYVTCPACIRYLKKTPQWANQLYLQGIQCRKPRRRLSKGRKADPRQENFGDLFDDSTP